MGNAVSYNVFNIGYNYSSTAVIEILPADCEYFEEGVIFVVNNPIERSVKLWATWPNIRHLGRRQVNAALTNHNRLKVNNRVRHLNRKDEMPSFETDQ